MGNQAYRNDSLSQNWRIACKPTVILLHMFFAPMKLLFLALLLMASAGQAGQTAVISKIGHMPSSSLILLGENERPIVSYQADSPRIPASTLKVLTAWLAIKHWGLTHRFHTDFFVDEQQILWIKGYGDPMLVSEEIERIARELYTKGLRSINGIHADASYFQHKLHIEGQSDSDNPYDAPVAALAANFNTLFLNKSSKGLRSAESQTPLTTTARQIAKGMKIGRQRVNLGDSRLSARYFAEILQIKLRQQGVDVYGEIDILGAPEKLTLFYRHYNSHTLEDVLRAMLRYSTNFIANQLFLMLGAEDQGAPANFLKAQSHAQEQVAATFHWEGFVIREGAGLSRANRISARQMIELLQAFHPYRSLLPATEPGILAKTGTLKGISCYAGYVEDLPFALFINQPAPYGLRKQVVTALRQLTKSTPVR
jgi:D-alanyl-D-alanine carboxypeptidase/D-alanyl-D-alanine-endopeptidase (penicillin-binding protein 4)